MPEREGNSMNITCYKCGQAGHIQTNCLHLTKVRMAAIRADGTEDPEMDLQEDDEALPPDKEGEGDSSEHQEEQPDVHMEPQYQWDTEEEEETEDNTISYRTNAIRIALDIEELAMAKIMAARMNTMVLSKTIEPMHNHRSRHRERPTRLPSDNHTLAGYWEINSVKAHCLLDSGSEGVLLSLEFTRAMGIKMFALEKPISLQLACIGSQSMINYGTHVTIKIGRKVVEEYFNIANVEHYDAILGTPFLRKMGIVLDFRSPGMAWIGNEVISTRKVFFDKSKDTKNNIATKGNIIQSSGAALDRE